MGRAAIRTRAVRLRARPRRCLRGRCLHEAASDGRGNRGGTGEEANFPIGETDPVPGAVGTRPSDAAPTEALATLVSFEQIRGRRGTTVVAAGTVEPFVDAGVGQAIRSLVALAGDVLELHAAEGPGDLTDLPVKADQRGILHPVPAGELFHQEPAVGAKE